MNIPPEVGQRRWSGYFNDFVLVVWYVNDVTWWFIQEKNPHFVLQARTALSNMKLEPNEGASE